MLLILGPKIVVLSQISEKDRLNVSTTFLHKIKQIVIFLNFKIPFLKLLNLLNFKTLKIYVILFLVGKMDDFRKEINLVLRN